MTVVNQPSNPTVTIGTAGVASSPKSAEYLAAKAEFHARSFPNSPQHAQQQSQPSHTSSHQNLHHPPAPSYSAGVPIHIPSSSHPTSSPSPSVSHSPISPKTSLALHAAHAALERERERARFAQRSTTNTTALVANRSEEGRNEHIDGGVEEDDSKEIFRPFTNFHPPPSPNRSHATTTTTHSSRRTLFAEEHTNQQQSSHHQAPPVRMSTMFSDRNPVAYQPSGSIASSPHSSPPRGAPAVSLHPLEPGDFLPDDAELELLDDDDVNEDDVGSNGYDEDGIYESSSSVSTSSHTTATAGSNTHLGVPSSSKILVAVRKRPLNTREKGRSEIDIVSIHGSTSLTVHEPKVRVDLTRYELAHQFHFDATFSEKESNQHIYAKMCKPLVGFVMAGRGGRATCFAYGQTGAG